MIFYGLILRLHYHMTSIGFISTYFSVLPWMLIAIGVVAFLVSAFGLIVSATEVKELLIGYAATMAIICIGLFATAMVCMLTRSVIDDEETFDKDSNTSPVHGKIDLGNDILVPYNYFQNQSFRENYDELQRSLRCCSFIGSDATGRFINNNELNPKRNCFPESCYVKNFDIKGVQHIRPDNRGSCRVCTTGNEENKGIYTTDCLAILKELYEDQLEDGMLWLSISVLITAIFGVAGVAMAAGYVGKLKRKERKQDFSQGQRMAMSDFQNEHIFW